MQVSELDGAHVLVAGARVTGTSVVRALTRLGARCTVSDSNPAELEAVAVLGAATALDLRTPPEGVDLVVTVPGFRPTAPLLVAAAAAGLPVWGDVELAWRCDRAEVFGPSRRWLAVTGTNGKTTTTTMLEAVLRADGRRTVACGNIGLTVLDALTDAAGFTDLAVELSSFQLHWAPSLRPSAGVVLNVAEDHLDWHGGREAYAAAKAGVLTGDVAVLGLDDPGASALVPTAARTVGFRLGEPARGEMGYVDGVLTDRAFAEDEPLVAAADVLPAGPPGRLDAAAAAALARAAGVSAAAVGAGLRAHRPGAHRGAVVATRRGVRYVDDSKATNPHAAAASLAAHPRVVWVAGGLLKGASVEDLVVTAAPGLAGVVLLGRDRGVLASALARHAPEVPVVEVAAGDDAAMVDVVRAAAAMASPGDTVLLAPAAASMDMFTDYAHRGRAFADAALALTEDAS
ncbi:UDP-N-acetylmuramoyl-L-alanine--D-glutamate ligase [Rhodococcus antarcticus]|uniref:UDP-N-acetylmuramoylalanine--D-glutamate ligase n=1 Tax=Rhodococcus antarcticus TaxID=2987751 RepID=A0ABY6NWP4_9NOCA|nr:UDP-N-acetylmuramoyl-L-alanine--D-glutamate ligase [Rhodococcus antarcticus]UZJ23526.1 UDP-N-acetylmuramoyl-L-alanine--D-glutamate ligase [Rhodococcus antarcticus]